MKSAKFLLILIAMCSLLMACTQNTAPLHRSVNSSLPEDIGIFGYSPVSYFEKNTAERGKSEYSHRYKDRVYYFVSTEQVETFKIDPEKYLPRYGEYCPYSLALGRRVGIDPTNFKVHKGQLLLFHDSVELKTVDLTQQGDLLERADKEYTLLKF